LATWFDDLTLRIKQLNDFAEELMVPVSLWISGLFNPMSFLTAIMQATARREGLPLDNMCLRADVLNVREPAELAGPPEGGKYIHGFFL